VSSLRTRRVAVRQPRGQRREGDVVGEILEHLARVLVGSGCPPDTLAKRFASILAQAPKPAAPMKPDALRYFMRAPHVLTHWHQDPAFLTLQGMPRALPLRGKDPSIATLASRVDGSLDARRVLDYLKRYRAVRRTRAGWLPRGRSVTYRGRAEAGALHAVRVLLGMLRCVSHNANVRAGERTWFEFIAENGQLPVRARRALDRRIWDSGMRFLQTMDTEMTRRESHGSSREPTMYAGVGVYAFEMPKMPEEVAPPRTGRKSRQDSRRR
jgi:hypothetical protein